MPHLLGTVTVIHDPCSRFSTGQNYWQGFSYIFDQDPES